MGPTIIVGILADPRLEPGSASAYAEEFENVQLALSATGVPYWAEPVVDQTSYFEAGDHPGRAGWTGLHDLRRLAAHVAATGDLPAPAPSPGEETGIDPVLGNLYELGPRHAAVVDGDAVVIHGAPSQDSFDHLIHHSASDGFYIPADFQPVILDQDILGTAIGSSHRLLEECRQLASLLVLPESLAPAAPDVVAATRGEITDPVGWQQYGYESYACLQMIAAAKRSLETGAAIVFT